MSQQLKKAINNLIFQEPFIGSLLPRLKIIEDNNMQCKTMATNGSAIFWDRSYIKSCSQEELRFTVAHEIFHCIMMHMFREFSRDHKKWNMACDYAINPLCNQLANCIPPTGLLMDVTRFTPGMTAEIIYDLLSDDEVPKDYKCDVIIPHAASCRSEEIDWKSAVAVAAHNAKQAGTLSVALEQMLDWYLNPKIPWQQLLYTWMTQTKARITNWVRPNRHYRAHGIFLPGKRKIPIGDFVLVYDVSGSMTDKAIRDSLQEVGFIVNEMRPGRVILIQHDSKITDVQEYSPDDELPTDVQILGRGGTNFLPVFDYIDTLENYPDAVVLFTDGYGPHPTVHPEYPVLWVMVETTPDVRMNFGEQIWLDP